MNILHASVKSTSIAIIIYSIFLLSGCQNMLKTAFYHIPMDNAQAGYIARGNAYTNFCLSKNSLDRQTGLEFSTAAAELLDLVVYDNDYYKNTYENTVTEMNSEYQKNPNELSLSQACKEFENDLPSVTTRLRNTYRAYARDLGVGRAEENQRIAESMANFRLPSTPIPQLTFPNVGYSQEKSQTQAFLIHTKSGLTQCRVTNGNFVFCL